MCGLLRWVEMSDAPGLRFAVCCPNTERFGNPRDAAALARTAEETGWEGFFTWDSLFFWRDGVSAVYDPWVVLSAVAAATESIRIGTCVAVVPRYKPQTLASTVSSLDALSGGRMTLGVGSGFFADEFEVFGESGNPRVRGEMLDESLDVVTRLWSGDEVNHKGTHYEVAGVKVDLKPVQQPRVPIWVGGDSRAALRRAARWDGWIGPTDPWGKEWTPDDLASFRESIEIERDTDQPYDIAWADVSQPDDGEKVEAYRQASATWWMELIDWNRGSYDEAFDRVAAGPPK